MTGKSDSGNFRRIEEPTTNGGEQEGGPIALVFSMTSLDGLKKKLITKCLSASLLRNLFGGSIISLQNDQLPLFRVDRQRHQEIQLSKRPSAATFEEQSRAFLAVIDEVKSMVRPQPRQWVVVIDPASISLRNIDHLLPPDPRMGEGVKPVDLYWASTRERGNAITKLASSGCWAVRGEYLSLVLDAWAVAWVNSRVTNEASPADVWTSVLGNLDLQIRQFEPGEIVAPDLDSFDWPAVSNAALVTLHDWPEGDAWSLLQALYFSVFLGDESGMMLNILDA